MEPYFTYLIGALLVAGWVAIETWLDYRKLGDFDGPAKDELVMTGVSHAILYGTFWPTVLILFVLGKVMATSRGK